MNSDESTDRVPRGKLECHMCDLEVAVHYRRHGVETTLPAGQPDEKDNTVWICPTCADIHTVEEVRSSIPVEFEEEQ